jgi:Holliday junction resolvase RusA-like endonuclease
VRISFFVEGDPRPKGSGSRIKGKRGKLGPYIESADKATDTRSAGSLKRWSETAAWEARSCMGSSKPIDGAVRVELLFCLPRTTKKKHLFPDRHGTGDVDKIARAVLDAMEKIVYTNDARACDLLVKKRFAEVAAGVHVLVRPLTPEEV